MKDRGFSLRTSQNILETHLNTFHAVVRPGRAEGVGENEILEKAEMLKVPPLPSVLVMPRTTSQQPEVSDCRLPSFSKIQQFFQPHRDLRSFSGNLRFSAKFVFFFDPLSDCFS